MRQRDFAASECEVAGAGATLRATGLFDGNILVTGTAGGEAAACIVDPGRGELVPDVRALPPRVDGVRTATALVTLADGVVAAVDARGTTLIREPIGLAGTAKIVTSPGQGTEVELVLPRRQS